LLAWLDPLALRFHHVCAPVFHCYACPLATFACPIGVVANFAALHIFPFVALGILVLLGAIFGGFICGWACPFGLLQDLAAKVSTPRIKLPDQVTYLRYFVLIGLVVLIPFYYGEGHPLFFCSVCPAGALEAAVPNIITQAGGGEQINWPNPIRLIILVLFLIAIFFIYRPWCRLLCPLGAVFGLFNRIAVFFLKFNPQTCTECGVCRDKCNLGILPDRQANDSSCIRCLECNKCPTQALTVNNIISSFKKGDSKSNST
jgi:polyferredoxin